MVQLHEFDDFKAPRRRPWLLLIVLLIAGGVFWWRTRPASEEKPPEPEPVGVVVDEGDVTADDVEVETPIRDMDLNLLLTQASSMESAGDLAGARTRYLRALRGIRDGKTRRDVQDRLSRINTELVFTPRAMPEKVEYIVAGGDYVGKIANKFKTTVELIQKSNKLANPNLIKKGDRLWVLQGQFRILVSKKRNELIVFLNDEFFKRYAVGTGKYGKTPVGTFKIAQKSEEPVWWRPDGKEIPFGDPENILGTRWMSLRATGDTQDVRGYGIHGTTDETSIGKAESAGCIRMKNADVEELYALVPGGTPVEIVE